MSENVDADESIVEDIVSQTPSLNLELDWEQYFKNFCDAHGKYPVLHGSLLLFPDGWQYSATDYLGPEYPPPTSKIRLTKLLLVYWQRRYEIVNKECIDLRHTITDLDNLQRGKSVPLSQRITYKDDEGKLVARSQQLDMMLLRKRYEWLEQDVSNCKKKLEALKYTNGAV